MRALAVICLLAACGPSHHGGDDDSMATLSIDPPMSDLTITNAVPATEDFTATLTYPDGTTKDVTADSTFTINSGAGDFNMSRTLTVKGAGKFTVTGVYSDKQNSAVVIVNANGNDIFEISLHTDLSDVRVYVPGGNGDAAAGPEPSWSAFLAAEWEAAVGNNATVTYQVRGVQSTNPPLGVGTSGPRLVKLSNEEMIGGIYYWASAGTTSPEGIWRHDMATPGQPAEQFMTKDQTGGRCIACHVLSRDGKNMLVTWDGGNGNANTIDVGTKAFGVEANTWNFSSFTPDGSAFLGVFNGTLQVRDFATQAVLASMPVSGTDKVTHPDVSPDGTMLTYVRVPSASYGADWHFGIVQIWIRPYDLATQTFGAEKMLVADASNNYYPSFSPDGKWVLFNKSADNAVGTGAYNNPSAEVWVIAADGSAPAVKLAALDAAIGFPNSWARWAPFAQTVGSAAINWI